MWEFSKTLFAPDQYIPHGHCYLWQTPLVGLHVVSDLLIAIAYFSIPAILFYFVNQRKDVPFQKVFFLFGAFIVFCGTSHLLEIWTLWHPAYWLSGLEKAATALISCYTALQMVELLPQFLALRTPEELETLNQELEQRVEERTAALQRSEEKFAKAFWSSPAVIALSTIEEGRFVEVNDSFSRILGYSPAEVVGNTSRDIQIWVNPNERVEILQELAAKGSVTNRECRFRHKSGEAIDFEISLETIQIDGENCLLIVGNDITARKQAEAALQNSQKFLEQVINAVADPIFVKDHQHRWTMINDAFCQTVGQSREDLLGKTDYDFFSPVEAEVLWKYDDFVFSTGTESENEETLTDTNGICRTTLTKKIAFSEPSGNLALVGISRDITDRKRIEDDRLHTEATLRRVAERERSIARVIQRMRQTLELDLIFSATTQELRQAIDCERVLVYRFNPDWSGQLVAESAAEGWTLLIREENNPDLTKVAVDHGNCDVKLMGSADDTIQDTYLQESRGGVYREGTSYRCVSDIYEANFSACYVELLEQFQARAYITVPILSGNRLWGLLGIYQNSAPRHWEEADIQIATQIGSQLGVAVQQAELLAQTKQQSAALQAAKESADAASLAKTEFLAHMSHELRTPLNAVLGFTQLMSGDATLSPQHQQYIGIISNSGEYLLKLINDILEMSKIEAGQATLNENDFDLHHLLDSLEEMLSLQATSKGLQLLFKRNADVPQYVKTDEGKLRQVLINLLGNAIKFTQSGMVCLQVGAERGNARTTRIHFAVEDTGSGIAITDRSRLFEPFSQTESGIRSFEGTGLGLPISQKFVQLMGGEIDVESQLGQGSVFTFAIGVKLAEEKVEPRPLHGRVKGLAPLQPVYRILVVDDEPTNRLLLVRLLTSLGFAVREAENGRAAIAVWEAWEPHLIWMDMRMPIMNGYEAIRQIKSSLKGQATVIIALTASAFEEQRQEVLAIGCDDFVRKPFRDEEVLEKIAQYLGVQYIYEEIDRQVPSGSAIGAKLEPLKDSPLTVDNLKVMPLEWVEQLYQTAAQCNDLLVFNLIRQIPAEYAPLANALTALVENFRFDEIIALVQPTRV